MALAAVVEHAGVLQHHRLHARVLRHLKRLQAAAAPAGVARRARDRCGRRTGCRIALFSASAQSIASVRSDAFVRGGWIWRRLCRGTRLARRSARPAQDAAARDHEIPVRGDLEQVQPAARAVVGTSAVAPGHDAQLHGAERGEIFRAVDDVRRQRRDFLFDRGETPGARRVGLIVVVAGLLRGRSSGRGDEHERGQERTRHSAADVMTGHARQYRM